MRLCQKHWGELREAIRARGIYHLVAKDGESAMKRTVSEINGTADDSTFDPLMAAYWAITGRAMELGGLYLMGQDENKNEYCPLCELDKFARNEDGSQPIPAASTQWINGCCDAQLRYCEEKGLVPKPS